MIYYKENISIFNLRGIDVIDFLQRVSTNDILKMGEKDCLRTIFLNEKGKIIDFVTVIKNESTILLVISKGNENKLNDFFIKYIVTDDVSFDVQNLNKLTFITENNEEFIGYEGFNSIDGNYLYSDDYRFKKHIVIENNKSSPYLKQIKDNSSLLTEAGFREIAIENAYVFDSNELNEEINPLECYLKDYISFNKGCYIGQEVISRLDSQAKIPKIMLKFKSDFELKRDDKIFFDDKGEETECGFISSAVHSQEGFKALGFLRNINLQDNNIYYVNRRKKDIVTINKFK